MRKFTTVSVIATFAIALAACSSETTTTNIVNSSETEITNEVTYEDNAVLGNDLTVVDNASVGNDAALTNAE